MKRNAIFVVSVMMAVLGGCSDTDPEGEGTLMVELWGEEYIEEGIPAAEFVDGFEVTFTTFLVTLSEVSVAEEGGEPVIEVGPSTVWNLTEAGPFELTGADVPAGDYTHTAYTIAPPTGEVQAGNTTEGEVDTMLSNGYSVYVIGTATDGTTTKSFEWGFTTETVYDPCHSGGAVSEGGEATVQLTIHGDHFFYDSAVSEEPSLRFVDLAMADADGDDDITEAELRDYAIGGLSNYGVGSLDIDNMWGYLSHMTTTLGHIDGEGHCDVQ